jgi:hypothetical protein
MALVPVQPFQLNDVTLTIGSDNYELSVNQVEVTRNVSVVRWRGMSPASKFAFAGAEENTLTLKFAQDFETANSLSNRLEENAGSVETFVFEPKKGARSVTVTALLVPGNIGGSLDAVAEATVSLPVVGLLDWEDLTP